VWEPIAFVAKKGLGAADVWLTDPSGAHRKRIAHAHEPYGLAWDHVGRRLAWADLDDLFILDTRTGRKRQLERPPTKAQVSTGKLAAYGLVAWDKAGKSIFVDMQVSGDVGPDAGVWRFSEDGKSTPQMILPPPPGPETTNAEPKVSPDGRYLAVGVQQGISFLALWFYDLEAGRVFRAEPYSGKLAKLIGQVSDYSWMPDGRRIMLASNPTSGYAEPARGPGSIFIWHITTGMIEKLLGNPNTVCGLSLSPDGSRFAYVIGKGDGDAAELWAHNMRTHSSKELLDFFWAGSGADSMSWAPDSKRLAISGRLSDAAEPSIWVVDTMSGVSKVIARNATLPSWSPRTISAR
jgi:WD40 repeat protein